MELAEAIVFAREVTDKRATGYAWFSRPAMVFLLDAAERTVAAEEQVEQLREAYFASEAESKRRYERAEKAEAERDRARAAIKARGEWTIIGANRGQPAYYHCSTCGHTDRIGHAQGCAWKAELDATEASK